LRRLIFSKGQPGNRENEGYGGEMFHKGVIRMWLRFNGNQRRGSTLMEKKRTSTRRRFHRLLALCAMAPSCTLLVSAHARPVINLSNTEALRIGKRIWQNECRGTIAGLTSWNAGENFASLGIGHFIWYPKQVRGPFEESFPLFLKFAESRHANLPTWLGQAEACPWMSRTEFLRAQDSPKMSQLREFLTHTIDLQAQFMVTRLQDSLDKMLDKAPPAERTNINDQFVRVASTSQGCYALVDYVNFKGEGTLSTEQYRGQGWGLLQVLEEMHGTGSGQSAVNEFSHAAAAVLKRRVRNSPPERKESRWLPGWVNRVKSYAINS
jgi:hypothetical protein